VQKLLDFAHIAPERGSIVDEVGLPVLGAQNYLQQVVTGVVAAQIGHELLVDLDMLDLLALVLDDTNRVAL
jgi:hypothetical protein